MRHKHKERNEGGNSILFGFLSKQGRGQWIKVSRLLGAAMGWRDELVLRTNHDYYNMHRNNLREDGSFYFSCAKQEKINGLSQHYQNQAYENLSRLRLIEYSKNNMPDNTTGRIINMHSTWAFCWLVYHHADVISKKYLKRYKHKMSLVKKCVELSEFYNKILKSKKLRKRYRNFVREMEKLVDDTEDLDTGEWDEKILDFYDDFIKYF